MRFTALKLCLSLIAFTLSLSYASAQASIKVIVNDTAISSYDIQQRAKLIALSTRKGSATARQLAEQELIEDALKLSEAKRLGVNVSDKEVNAAYGDIARNVKLSPAKLSTALRQSGVNPQTLKDRLKAQIAWQKTVRARFQSQVKIDESAVIAALKKADKEDANTSVEYDLSQVVVVVPHKASSSFKAKRQAESSQIRKDFNGCDTAGTVLGQYNEVVLKPIGRRLETELPGPLKTMVHETEIGHLTKPQQTERGFEMIAVCGKREIASDLAVRTEVENELRVKEGEQMMRRYLRELQQRATIVHR